MGSIEHSLLPLGLVLFFGLFVPQVLHRLRLPSTTTLILAGLIAGPHGLKILEPNETLKLFAFFGATFLMLLAGFEAEKLQVDFKSRDLWILFGLNGLVPALIGFLTISFLNYDLVASALMAAIFLSSSIILIFSFCRHLEISQTRLGRSLKSVSIFNDLSSTLLLFLAFRSSLPSGRFPLPILLGLLVCSVILMRMFLPEFVAFAFKRIEKIEDHKEGKLRLLLALLIGTVLVFSAAGVHAVVGAFLVGFSLASLPEVEPVREKLRVIGYGVFVPAFLFVVGSGIDLKSLLSLPTTHRIVALLVVLSLASKVITGYLGARWIQFTHRESLIFGLSSSAKLTVPLSATYTAFETGLIDSKLFTSVVFMSLAGSIMIPFTLNLYPLKGATKSP